MAHIHGNKSDAAEITSAAGAGAAKMMDSAMEKMGTPAMMEGMGPMMGMREGMMSDMGPMMGMAEGMRHGMGPMMGMAEGMKHGMGPMMGMAEGMRHGMGQAMNPGMGKGVAYGLAASAGAGKRVLKKVLTHPVTLIGLGFLVGYLAHKYRKSIIPTSGEVSEGSSGEV
jgi:hypothetical protein